MGIELTYDEAVALLKRAVEEKGEDYVYPAHPGPVMSGTYLYFSAGKPDCAIGHVLAYKGMTEISPLLNPLHVSALWRGGVIDCDVSTYHLLRGFQDQQDEGVPWGECLRVATGGTP